MRKFFSIIIMVIVALCLVCGCTNSNTEAMVSSLDTTDEKYAPVGFQEGIHDNTSWLKEDAYRNFEGKTEFDLVQGDKIDFAKLFELAGMKYRIVDDGIIAASSGYNLEESFVFFIRIDPEYHIVNGSTLFKGYHDDKTWEEIIEHDSATDFIFDAKLGDNEYRIGADELDYLWREIRVLTAPADKIDAVNAAVDAEFESYMVDSIPEK